uniref:Uncharacterized protein n=1 Tax=Grammatophora oceanica TaxID=210454 RepID=A0A7S1Y2C0_9STRA|mmetsp:Transcript_17815/g.26361  ORF Transcript_17815/g.26361 Transcript_17815/m.26361 type:complete len:405 (+) Transcript_17815:199-1413(+)|eukprot:CAMPEP_0194026220 /NCGR_PEP_ID=MMETSP0009_2-20130614/537_1 /TAXON_ID=210454 /ORGANISM="Grammatophora oceanica, Strain CCMP 410" /LENGTH=404 /DNA_ID=CAMNT_0038664787 /DNA_START=132 /DNA_END=1346 /DNA_ORIENTATION=-
MTSTPAEIARAAAAEVAALAASTSDPLTVDDESSDSMMLAFVVTKSGGGRVARVPRPTPEAEGYALIHVMRAGVCNTDLEILKGYMGFQGILGHEFVGKVVDIRTGDDSLKTKYMNKRVCGDINVGCFSCRVCQGSRDSCCSQMSRNHCPNRTVLGILNRNGTMAEYLTLPVQNLHLVPDHISDEDAVFSEPLAAACRIVEQGLVSIESSDKVAILGDGKLGLMIAEVMGREYLSVKGTAEAPEPPILFGKHDHKLKLVENSGVITKMVSDCQDDSAFNGVAAAHAAAYDVVVDATGNPAALLLAAGLCRPMGTVVLKSTCAAGEQFNAAPFVIDELRVIGSRCGPIDKALELLALQEDDAGIPSLRVQKYVTKTFPLSQAKEAVECAAKRETMKVQIICSTSD